MDDQTSFEKHVVGMDFKLSQSWEILTFFIPQKKIKKVILEIMKLIKKFNFIQVLKQFIKVSLNFKKFSFSFTVTM